LSRNMTVSPGREEGGKGDTSQRQGPGCGEGTRIGSRVAPEKTLGVSPSDRFILHRVVSGRTEIHRSCPLPHHQKATGGHRHARPGVPGERGGGIAQVARNGGWRRQRRGKYGLFCLFSLSASRLAVPCRHGRWAGDGWGGACSRAHRARSDGADPVQQRYPRRRSLAWLDCPRGGSADERRAKSWAYWTGDDTPDSPASIKRRRKCCLSSKTPRIAAGQGPNWRAILGAYDMKGGGVRDSDDSARPRVRKCSFDNTHHTPPQRPRWRMTGS